MGMMKKEKENLFIALAEEITNLADSLMSMRREIWPWAHKRQDLDL